MTQVHERRRTAAPPSATLALLVAVACGACKPDRPGPSGLAPATGGSAAAKEDAAPAAEVEGQTAEDVNEGCKFRKNSGAVAGCGKNEENFGAWAPSQREALGALRAAGGLCYCAPDLIEPVRRCMAQAGASTVTVRIGKDDEDTDCTIAVAAASEGGRRWVKFEATVRDRATIYATDSVLKRGARAYVPYYQGFDGIPGDDAIAAAGPDQGEVTAELKRDWPRLSAPLRAFLRRR